MFSFLEIFSNKRAMHHQAGLSLTSSIGMIREDPRRASTSSFSRKSRNKITLLFNREVNYCIYIRAFVSLSLLLMAIVAGLVIDIVQYVSINYC